MIDLGLLSLGAARERRQQLVAEAAALDGVISALEAYIAARGDGAPIDSADQDVRSGASSAEPEPGDLPPVASAPANQQPAQGARRVGPVRVGSPAPASRPRPVRSGAAAADRGSSPAGEGTSAGTRRPARKPAKQRPAASLPHGNPPRVTCPDCEAEVRPGGLGTHRRIKHGHRAEPKPSIHQCPECSEALPTSRGLAIHRRFKHGVLGKSATEAAKAVQPIVVDEALRPDPTVFPDAPRTAYVEDGVLVIGEQAWTPEQWNGRDGRQYRAQRAPKRAERNPRTTPPLELPPRLDRASGE